MALKCGIVGLPNVGKSTLFNALTRAGAKAVNFPFCTIEPNIGMIAVPDRRLDRLSALLQPEKTTPATVEIMDIAGLVKGASKGEGLGNRFLGNIRETNAIIHVLRCFKDPNIVHVSDHVDPLADKEIVEYELLLKDLETLEKAISKVEKPALTGEKDARKKMDIYSRLKLHLEKGKPVRSLSVDDKEKEIIRALFLITSKPVLYVCNVDEHDVRTGNAMVEQLKIAVKEEDSRVLTLTAAIEAEIAMLDSEEDKKIFTEEMQLDEPGVNRVIRAAYELLGLITFFTAGKPEVRAWTIRKGTNAQKAAAEIHSDIERGFICAEITRFEDYINCGSEHKCKEAGLTAIVGRDYVMRDGDITYFRFNV